MLTNVILIINKDFRRRVDFVVRQTWKNIEKMYNLEASKYDVTFSISFTLISIDPENGSPSTSIGPSTLLKLVVHVINVGLSDTSNHFIKLVFL